MPLVENATSSFDLAKKAIPTIDRAIEVNATCTFAKASGNGIACNLSSMYSKGFQKLESKPNFLLQANPNFLFWANPYCKEAMKKFMLDHPEMFKEKIPFAQQAPY